MTHYKELLGKEEIKFWLPIITTAVTITISYMLLSNQIALLSQKIDTLENKILTFDSRVSRLSDAVNMYIGDFRQHIGASQ
jgi:cell division protein FtsL